MAKNKSGPVSTGPSPADDGRPVHEIDDRGFHRIVCGQLVSQWFVYAQVAVLKNGPVVYNAATDYHSGFLPSGVFVTKVVK